MYSLYGVENPLMDVVAHVDYAFLRRFGKSPGAMHLVEYSEVAALLSEIPSALVSPGGSAANTARGIAWLASAAGEDFRRSLPLTPSAPRTPVAPPVFNGAIGRDERGQQFVAGIEAAGVVGSLVRTGTPTGTSVILVTPDGERTMNTFLGACRDFRVEDLDLQRLADSRLLYLTGYLWDTDNQRRAAEHAAEFARARAIPIAFDLADPFAVRRYSAAFRQWLPGRVDALFGNRDELALLTGGTCNEDCLSEASRYAPLVVMKVGEQGCLVAWEGRQVPVVGNRAHPVDTTGAGDAFAAGFLFGQLQGSSPIESARLANAVAERVVGVEGCRYGV